MLMFMGTFGSRAVSSVVEQSVIKSPLRQQSTLSEIQKHRCLRENSASPKLRQLVELWYGDNWKQCFWHDGLSSRPGQGQKYRGSSGTVAP